MNTEALTLISKVRASVFERWIASSCCTFLSCSVLHSAPMIFPSLSKLQFVKLNSEGKKSSLNSGKCHMNTYLFHMLGSTPGSTKHYTESAFICSSTLEFSLLKFRLKTHLFKIAYSTQPFHSANCNLFVRLCFLLLCIFPAFMPTFTTLLCTVSLSVLIALLNKMYFQYYPYCIIVLANNIIMRSYQWWKCLHIHVQWDWLWSMPPSVHHGASFSTF